MGGKLKIFYVNFFKKYVEWDILNCGVLLICVILFIDFSDLDDDE